ncbi:MAG: archaemetzincin family Zn-dependent metalloprotease [Bacteroidota bacterium]
MIPPIRLVPLTPFSEEIVYGLVSPLADVFKTNVTVGTPVRNIVDSVYDYSRGQYNSTLLIKELLRRFDGQTKILGITSVDLFVPVLTYVFGEAQLDGVAGVMSTFRLDDTIYGLPQDKVKFFERCIKESVHELGHTFGLFHCKNFNCAMHSSTTVDDIDIKGGTLCKECSRKIGV